MFWCWAEGQHDVDVIPKAPNPDDYEFV